MTIKSLLHILQQEEYDLDRFTKWIKKHPKLTPDHQRRKIVWTPKAYLLFALSSTVNFLMLGQKPVTAIRIAVTLTCPLDFSLKAITTGLSRAKLWTRALQKRKPIVIGITGSYGKTSTKHLLTQLLENKYCVLATPKSYNTPMGVAVSVLKHLKPKHEVFIVEMGAYQKGEIKQLCRLVKPGIGILTAIGPMHLERFGSIDNIKKAKYELIESLPKNGFAVFNGDDQIVRELSQETELAKIIYSVDATKTTPPISSARIEIRYYRENQKESDFNQLDIETNLLGKHQLSNLAAAAAAALHLGITAEEIQEIAPTLTPPPHRLRLIDPGSGILIIDDTYSSNPVGFREALEVLNKFKDRRKILITPGIVELGDQTASIHQSLGRQAADICDCIILVGNNIRTKFFQGGTEKAGFDQTQVHSVQNMQEAQKTIEQLCRPMDIILFENDVPDKYL